MKKKILLVLCCCLLFTGCSKEDNFIGIYHNSSWNTMEATITLEKDGKCQYPSSYDNCNWKYNKDDKTIEFELYTYDIQFDSEKYANIDERELSKCEEQIEHYEKIYNYENSKCVKRASNHKAYIVTNGLMLYEHLFEKQ